MTIEELKAFIRQQAVSFKQAEEDWEWESVERDTFEKVYGFMLDRGWLTVSEDLASKVAAVQEAEKDESSDEDEISDQKDDIYLQQGMELHEQEDSLAADAQELYSFFKSEFGYYN